MIQVRKWQSEVMKGKVGERAETLQSTHIHALGKAVSVLRKTYA